jgi:hypothetical protein
MPLIMHSAPVRRAKAGVPTGNNNPDSYAAATEIYGSKDYETEVSGDVLSQEDIAIGTWGAAYGYGSTGAWRFTPRPITSGSNEDSAGWYADTGTIPVDECSVLTYSFMFYISQALVTKILDSGTSFWGSNNKVIDVFMWNSGGTAVDTNTRQIVMFGKSNGTIPGLIFTPIAGGGGGIGYAETSIDPLVDLDFTDLADQWIWLSFVMDASGATDATRYTRLYYKKVGDAGVTKFYDRDGTEDGGGGADDTYRYTTRGWYGDQGRTVFGYWDDMVGGTALRDANAFVVIDRLRVANGWVDPPF